MAQQDLDRILTQLKAESLDTQPIAATAERIEMLADSELAKLKKTKEAGEITSMVDRWHTQCKSARTDVERQWQKNLDMYQGRQFTMWNNTLGRMTEPPAPDYEPRIAVNIIEPTCRTEMAKTGANKPSATVAPSSNDYDDIMRAQAGEHAWEWFYRTSKFHSAVFNPANFWRTVCGNSFVKTFFDETEEDEAATEAARLAYERQVKEFSQVDPSMPGAAMPMDPTLFLTPPVPVMGKIRAEAVSPFHVFVPDLAQIDLHKQDYMIHAYPMNFEKAKMVYAQHLPKDKDWNPTKVSANEILNVMHLGIKGGNNAALDSVMVLETYIRPGVTPLMPKGGLVVTVGGEIVGMSSDGLPYKHKQFPFAMLTGIESGRFYRKSVVESITPIQNELNRTYAQIIKNKNLLTKPMFFYDEGSLDPTRVRSKAGTFIPIRLGMKYPQPVPMQDLPSYVMDLIGRLKEHLDDISGQHQVSRATSPGADTAASALALLQETDDNFLSTTFDSIESCMETVARHTLTLMVQFWDEPRLVKVIGVENAFDAKMLKGADLANGTDIHIDEASSLPTSKAGKIAIVTEWIDKGIVTPEMGLEAMEMGTLGKVYQRIKLDRDAARRENIEIRDLDVELLTQHYQGALQAQQEMADPFAGLTDPALGIEANPMADPAAMVPPAPPLFFPINWYDNDAIHIEEHKAFAKSQQYRMLPPEIQNEFEQHTAAHKMRLSEQMMQQAAMGGGEEAPTQYAGATEPQTIAA